MKITHDQLVEVLKYDPATGEFHWLIDAARNVPAGSIAGSFNSHGARRISFGGRSYSASRLAWLYMKGEWPSNQVDHIDTDPGNNRWVNLRVATNAQNGRNRGAARNNRLGVKGVHRSRGGRFVASIYVDHCKVYLGTYSTPEKAAAVYALAAHDLHGEFARTS